MRIKIIILSSLLLIVGAFYPSQGYAQKAEINKNPPLKKFPDLVVFEIKYNIETHKVRVEVHNNGQAQAASCNLALTIFKVKKNEFLKAETFVVTRRVKPLNGGEKYAVVFQLSPPESAFVYIPSEAFVDSDNEVHEWKEDNNTKPFIEKPIQATNRSARPDPLIASGKSKGNISHGQRC